VERAIAHAAPRRVSLVTSETRVTRLPDTSRCVEVEVVSARSRREGLQRATADWIVFLRDDVEPDDGLIDALVHAQSESGADLVTAAVRREDGVRLFMGDPRALGLVANHYGVVGLSRRSLLAADAGESCIVDLDWLLFAQLVLDGGAAATIPVALASFDGQIGTISDVPGDGVLVLEAFEQRGASVPDVAQLAATAVAALQRAENPLPQAQRSFLQRVRARVRR
jgi:hypothetical protein